MTKIQLIYHFGYMDFLIGTKMQIIANGRQYSFGNDLNFFNLGMINLTQLNILEMVSRFLNSRTMCLKKYFNAFWGFTTHQP